MAASSSAVAQRDIWELGSGSTVEIDATGRIVDFLDSSVTRADTEEERVRQSYARVLVEEYDYPKDRMAFEAPIQIGSEKRSADIAIYTSPEARSARDQGQIRLLVETKAPTKQGGREQLKSYISGSSAEGGVWTDGEEVAYFRRVEDDGPKLKEWTNIPRFEETWDTVGNYRKSDLKPPTNLKQVFQRCHNAIYRAGLDSEDVALDMVRIILAKYRDEQDPGEVCEFRCTPEEFATKEGRQRVATRVHKLFKKVLRDHPDVFREGEQITIGDENLAAVVNELQPFRFLADRETEQVYDVIGTAFEVYVAAHLKGDRGQYFTNRLVVDMMVEMVDPSERDVVTDPAAGSGGFLVAVLRYLRHKINQSDRSNAAKVREVQNMEDRLFGLDVSPKLVRVAKTNMILNGDGHGGIRQANTLRDLRDELPRSFPLHPESPSRQDPTAIFTNPPFGASDELREKNPEVLEDFALGHVWREEDEDRWLRQTEEVNDGFGVPPEVLFLERCIDMLAPGGRVAIVIARGVLDNKEALAARQYLLRHTKLLGIVNCHPNTFQPFNGTKASVLILEKKESSGFQRDEDYPVFMAVSQRVGQDSQGRAIYERDTNGELVLEDGQPVLDHDLDRIAEAWREYRSGKEVEYEAAWSVQLSRMLDSGNMRFNPVRYAPEAEKALAEVLELADSKEWRIERLGDLATVFNGPRFKRPYADEGVTSGPGIKLMYTPKAFFEKRGQSAKYLDLSKASSTQKRQIETLTLEPGWIMIVDSGTAGKLLGRVGMTTSVHDGTVGNNNMIRVIMDDPVLRDYTYLFLRSDIGQKLILRNVYGTNQDHVEPDDVKDIPVPVPRDLGRVETVHEMVRQIIDLRERADALDDRANDQLNYVLEGALESAEAGDQA